MEAKKRNLSPGEETRRSKCMTVMKEILPRATTWMNLENTVLSDISQTQKAKYCVVPLLYGPYKSQTQRDVR